MRLYLDTNILVFLATGEEDEINADVEELLNDYENHLLTSTVCVHELIHLFQIGKIHTSRNGRISDASEFESWLSDMGIEVIPVTVKNLKEYAKLPMLGDHRLSHDHDIDKLLFAKPVVLVDKLLFHDRYHGIASA
jgi:PIN domain nuclease of toxin-antitoxin system